MLPSYNLVIDIETADTTISEEQFREQVAHGLKHLDALKGAFDRSPCTVSYYPPSVQYDRPSWSVRAVIMISVGKKRAEYLLQLYEAMIRLTTLELPHLIVRAEIAVFDFS